MRSGRPCVVIACCLVVAGWLGLVYTPRIAVAQDDLVLTHGTVITVTSTSDDLNGVPDGISLREAIRATNADPGLYTIEFAPSLAGQTIDIETDLPELAGGGVIINGDVDGDLIPDVAVRAPARTVEEGFAFGFVISSGDNTLHALELVGWELGVGFRPATPGAAYANTTIANVVIRGGRNGIVLNAPGSGTDVRANENTWVNTRIMGNQIDAALGGVSVGFGFTIGDAVEGLVIRGNEIHVAGGDGSEEAHPAIGLSAGFWDGSTDNQITDVVIAGNTITGLPGHGIVLSTGQVGASANLISGVRIEGNMIGTRGILVSASDATTAWVDPDYTPVAYPDDNAIRDIEIVDNTIRWDGFGGIQIIASSPGDRNVVEDVHIVGNDLRAAADEPAMFISVAAGDQASANRVRNLRIEDNTIRLTGPDWQPPGIQLMGAAHGADENELSDVYVARNDIEGNGVGIHLHGGDQDSARNHVSEIDVVCNRIGGSPEILITGGRGPGATGNVVSDVVLAGNLTGDVLNDVMSAANTDGAQDNTVDWTVDDQMPEDCPITAPTTTTSPPPTTTPDEPETAPVAADAENGLTATPATFAESSPVTNPEAGSDSSPPTWVWVGGGVTLAFAAGWFLRSRFRT